MKQPGLTYESPEAFTCRQRMMLAVGASLAASAFKALCATCRMERQGLHHFNTLTGAGQHVILAIWHETLGLAAWHHRNTGYHTLTSYSFDGELAARVVRCFGLYALRGSSSRGGFDALKEMQRATALVPALGFTLDGPKGPRRVAKPGVAILALKTGLPIIPQAFSATPCWRMRSWDHFIVPKPFGRLVSVYGEPIYPPPKGTPGAIESLRAEVENSLNRLHESLEQEFPEDSAR